MNKRHAISATLRNKMTATVMLCLTLTATLTACSQGESLADSGQKPEVVRRGQLAFNLSMNGEPLRQHAVTRGTPTETLSEDVGLYQYVFSTWYSNTMPSLVNEQMQDQGDKWVTVNGVDLPAAGRSMRFYAYYPFQSDDTNGVTLTGENDAGVPRMTYDVPSTIEDQYDIMMGRSSDLPTDSAGENHELIQMQIYHRLTAVFFTAGSFPKEGQIQKIRLMNVVGKGEIRLDGTTAWTLSSDPADLRTYEEEVNYDITNIEGPDNRTDVKTDPDTITTGYAVFLMIPQTRPSTATLEIDYLRKGETLPITLSANIGNIVTSNGTPIVWEPGKKVFYRLSVDGLMNLVVNTQIHPWGDGGTISSDIEEGSTIVPESSIRAWNNSDTQVTELTKDTNETTPSAD